MSILLSVITISNGDLIQLEKTFKSIPDFEWLEWILVTSLDESEENLPKSHKTVYKSRSGIFAAMNQGLEVAGGELILFLNAGDAFAPFFDLEIIRKSYEQYRWDWLIGGALRDGVKRNLYWENPHYKSWRFRAATRSFCHQSTFVKTQLIRDFGGFDETSLISDWLMSVKLARFRKPFVLNEIISVIEPGGVSTKMPLSYRISEPHRLRSKYSSLIGNRFTDYVLQLFAVMTSQTFGKLRRKFF